jgi:hypothetical protein
VTITSTPRKNAASTSDEPVTIVRVSPSKGGDSKADEAAALLYNHPELQHLRSLDDFQPNKPALVKVASPPVNRLFKHVRSHFDALGSLVQQRQGDVERRMDEADALVKQCLPVAIQRRSDLDALQASLDELESINTAVESVYVNIGRQLATVEALRRLLPDTHSMPAFGDASPPRLKLKRKTGANDNNNTSQVDATTATTTTTTATDLCAVDQGTRRR